MHVYVCISISLCMCMCLCAYISMCVKACRGSELDDGKEVHDAIGEQPAPAQRIPIEADFLYAYSTTPGLSLSLCLKHPGDNLQRPLEVFQRIS